MAIRESDVDKFFNKLFGFQQSVVAIFVLQVLEFMQRHTEAVDAKGLAQHKAHLAGNSVYMDQAFLKKYMPRIFAHLHWRLIDISTLLELARRWYPEEHRRAPKKKVGPLHLLFRLTL